MNNLLPWYCPWKRLIFISLCHLSQTRRYSAKSNPLLCSGFLTDQATAQVLSAIRIHKQHIFIRQDKTCPMKTCILRCLPMKKKRDFLKVSSGNPAKRGGKSYADTTCIICSSMRYGVIQQKYHALLRYISSDRKRKCKLLAVVAPGNYPYGKTMEGTTSGSLSGYTPTGIASQSASKQRAHRRQGSSGTPMQKTLKRPYRCVPTAN